MTNKMYTDPYLCEQVVLRTSRTSRTCTTLVSPPVDVREDQTFVMITAVECSLTLAVEQLSLVRRGEVWERGVKVFFVTFSLVLNRGMMGGGGRRD